MAEHINTFKLLVELFEEEVYTRLRQTVEKVTFLTAAGQLFLCLCL